VFAFDPTRSRLSGRFLQVSIPFEADLEPGPSGGLVEVVDYDPRRDLWYSPVNLDDPLILAQAGLAPSESDPRSHQQIVYAVAMSVIEHFQRFTGRRFRWRGDDRLRIVPHAFYGRNAFFDPTRRAVLFGYYRADDRDTEANLPEQLMFTCLSVDIIAHEVTHAIVHRLRPLFTLASNPDVFAFHEGFSDVIALFHHFLFPEVVEAAVAQSRSELEDAAALFSLAEEFGLSTGRGGPLRSALHDAREREGDPEHGPDPRRFIESTEPHERGAIFVSAIFSAYLASFKERIRDLRRLATGGSGVLGGGELSPDLVRRIAAEATHLADAFLGMVVRAFDFLPPVDVTFGDVVRAIITADIDLYPEDANLLRARLVESLRQHGIFPAGVVSLADQALLWRRPAQSLSLAEGTSAVDLSQLILDSTMRMDPRSASSSVTGDAAKERGQALWRQMNAWAREHAYELGLDPHGGKFDVEGLHVAFQVAEDRQPRPRIIAQIVQRRHDLEVGPNPNTRTRMYAGCTIVANVDGVVCYVIPKPLPLTNHAVPDWLPGRLPSFVQAQHRAGVERHARMVEWAEDVAEKDPLAAWLTAPSLTRLTFANLHAQPDGEN